MITNKLSEIAGRKRIKMSEIARMTDIGYSTIQRLYNNQVSRIEFDVLNKLCNYLECTPNDILEFTPDKE